ncbi:hypothetical protein GCM10022243_44770 [Saccharothrix violaceirubra]|uniref:Nitrite reductase/ring-hydroxylating ferredoxin subunit n=1 Tax=Saccharothrix violaceirubra TaxID=413306 RepID=A0A7W7T135_9PSEU|nr:Rieske (2Fe-2S) protein [Saccharothrix violaceirubra]MBB4964634.1 nitrite reductase/ring-hydroxylating ferredoxin subunit [Saccharothrix violaceirubra]
MTTTPTNDGLSRRRMLCGVLAALAVPAGLAACSDSPTTSSGPGTTPGTTTKAGDATTKPTAAGGSGIVALADVPDGGGVVVESDGRPLVLVRSGDTVKAFDATCPHQLQKVAPPVGDVITCPAHGSRFKATDGSRIDGPTPSGLDAVPVKVAAGQVVLA